MRQDQVKRIRAHTVIASGFKVRLAACTLTPHTLHNVIMAREGGITPLCLGRFVTWPCLAGLVSPWCVFVFIAADGVQWSSVPQQGSSAPAAQTNIITTSPIQTHAHTNTHSDSGALPFPNPSSKHSPDTRHCPSLLSRIRFPEKYHMVCFCSLFFL